MTFRNGFVHGEHLRALSAGEPDWAGLMEVHHASAALVASLRPSRLASAEDAQYERDLYAALEELRSEQAALA